MQDTEGSSFITYKPPTMKPIKIKLKEKTALSLNGVDVKEYPKGKELTSTTTSQHMIFRNLIQSGKAEESGKKPEKKAKGQKVKKPAEKKSQKKESTSKKGSKK